MADLENIWEDEKRWCHFEGESKDETILGTILNQIIEQTDKEKTAMYMKCTKKELIEMLIECNKQLNYFSKQRFKVSHMFR